MFYVDHECYNAQPHHNELIGYIIVLQKVSISSINMHDELGKKAWRRALSEINKLSLVIRGYYDTVCHLDDLSQKRIGMF